MTYLYSKSVRNKQKEIKRPEEISFNKCHATIIIFKKVFKNIFKAFYKLFKKNKNIFAPHEQPHLQPELILSDILRNILILTYSHEGLQGSLLNK